MTLNIPLATEVLSSIRLNPAMHGQPEWAHSEEPTVDPGCGTTLCVAGWACYLAGDSIDWRKTTGGKYLAHTVTLPDNSQEEIPVRAKDLLGLDGDDASLLFYASSEQRAVQLLAGWIEQAAVPA
ncbi:hypothetical protein SEA_VANLEE_105 [Gordonia phage VanLee]|uniref:Uncharacterized protein n=1 Tax=Gordonia phage VanLee TaxID=2845816 RepID=A0A8F2DAF5_9CAUD|nr:hypothetical protein QEH49_gp105 [Gordonia phage VanLee]QWS68222.1 hypothetical protein SEA_VANLEE_105 [Gordonia phage VanLee]